jgi:hypothetical protein
MKTTFLFITAFLALVSCSFAFDPSPLQDFCVAINDTKDGGNYAFLFSFIYYYTTRKKGFSDRHKEAV